jgi:hypothetical protein
MKQKTPLWFIVAMISYAIPIGVLILIFPIFGEMWYQLCQLQFVGFTSCEFPPNNMWVITTGLEWSAFLDVVLIIWAYITWKLDYLIPWLEIKFNTHGRETL